MILDAGDMQLIAILRSSNGSTESLKERERGDEELEAYSSSTSSPNAYENIGHSQSPRISKMGGAENYPAAVAPWQRFFGDNR